MSENELGKVFGVKGDERIRENLRTRTSSIFVNFLYILKEFK
jgi:hypothetical protein